MTVRVGARQLEDLRRSLTRRDLDVLASVDQYRLLTTTQLQRLHFADHRSDASAARVCRRVLARLTDHRVLVRLRRRVGGVRAGSAGHIHAVGPLGHRLLDPKRQKRWREPGTVFVDHTLAIAELAISTLEHAAADQHVLVVETEPSCWRTFTHRHTPMTVKPDLALVTATRAHEWRWFIEVDLGTESGPAIGRKCRIYDTYWRSGVEQHRHDVYPRVLWVASSRERAEFMSLVIAASGAESSLFAVTTTDSAVDIVFGGES
ncbi:MAG: hypothetical protein DHS20C19_23690 [Acidimicrobiales bacterium]|nr:MAG: hypothetical protein DHS20C19_23690 [Acidimicrobiales bacterium]